MSKLAWLLGLLSILILIPAVNAISVPSTSAVTSSLLGAFTINSSDTPIYAALFALVIFVIFYQMLQRTTLGNGAAAIAFVFAAITFVFLYTTPSYIQLFLTVSVMTAVMAILLVVLLIPTRRGTTFSRMVGLILLATLFYLLLSNNSSLSNYVNNLLHINVLNILPLIIVGGLVIGVIILLIRAFRNTTHPGLRAIIPILILGLIIFFFVPGAGAFLLNPLSLIFYGLVFIGIIIWFLRANRKPKGEKEDIWKKPLGWGERRQHFELPGPGGAVKEGKTNGGTGNVKIEHLPPPAPHSTKGPLKPWSGAVKQPTPPNNPGWVVGSSRLSDKKTEFREPQRDTSGKMTGKNAGYAKKGEERYKKQGGET